MVKEVISALSTAAGIYILAKRNGEKKGSRTAQEDFDQKVEEMAADKLAEQQAAEAAKDPRYRAMYFGDKEEVYDPFYDYSNDPIYFSEEMLEKANTWKDRMCYTFRARFVSPFVIESGELGGYPGWWTDAREGLFEINTGGVKHLGRDFFKGTLRYYTLMMEVFNPINSPAPLKKICFKDIKIGDKDCQVFNDGGFYHEASGNQMYRMNRKWYKDTKTSPGAGLAGAVNVEYIKRVYEYQCNITIPARSSVYVCVMLPLSVQQDNGYAKLVNASLQNIFDLCSQSEYAWNMYDPIDTDFRVGGRARLAAEEYLARQNVYLREGDYADRVYRRIYDNLCGCSVILFNSFKAPDSLATSNLSAKVMVCSSEDNYIQEGDPDNRTPKTDCPAFDLKIMHGGRPISSRNIYDWQNAYFDEWEGELPIKMVNLDPEDSIKLLEDYLLNGADIDYYDFNQSNIG